MKQFRKLLTALLLTVASLSVAHSAHAAGTQAGLQITNQATLDYSVGGHAQPTSNSTVTSFNVDRKVNFTVNYVAPTGNFVDVYPGSTDQALKYTITNTGNDTQDFDLSVVQQAGGAVFTGTDTIDATNVRIFLDSNANGAFDAAGDTDITGSGYLDEVTPDQQVTIFIVGNFPTPQVNANVAGLTVNAVALHGHGASAKGSALSTSGTDTITASGNAVYTVFADAGLNHEAALGAFRISAPVLNIAKSAKVIWDPVNFNATPRTIPGSYVQYAITITNAATALASANLTTIQDTLNANTLLDPDFVGNNLTTANPTATAGSGLSFMVTHTAATRTTATPSYYGAGSGMTVNGQSITADFQTVLPAEGSTYSAGELKPGEEVTVTFNVKIS